MTHLTIAIDEEVLRRAQERAERQGTSIPDLLQHYLEQYGEAENERSRAVQALLELARNARSGSGGQRWTRDDLYER